MIRLSEDEHATTSVTMGQDVRVGMKGAGAFPLQLASTFRVPTVRPGINCEFVVAPHGAPDEARLR